MRIWVIDTLVKTLVILFFYMLFDTAHCILRLSMSINWVG